MTETIDLPVPPKELRLWVGPFEDEGVFLRSGFETVALLQDMAMLRHEDSILDVGCGSGRVALALVNYLSPAGRYLGFDVSIAAVRWCQDHISTRFPNFRFEHLDVRHPEYSPGGQKAPEEI